MYFDSRYNYEYKQMYPGGYGRTVRYPVATGIAVCTIDNASILDLFIHV